MLTFLLNSAPNIRKKFCVSLLAMGINECCVRVAVGKSAFDDHTERFGAKINALRFVEGGGSATSDGPLAPREFSTM